MKSVGKRALTLIIASVVSSTGILHANEFKNNLMSLEIENNDTSTINVKLLTKTRTDNTIIPKKIDSKTFVIMLPGIDSKNVSTPKVSAGIENISIKTMPYTANNNGYTKITIRTSNPNIMLQTGSEVYVPSRDNQINSQVSIPERPLEEVTPQDEKLSLPQNIPNTQEQSTENTEQKNNISDTPNNAPAQNNTVQKSERQKITQDNINNPADNSEKILFILGFLCIVTICAFIFVKGQNKLKELLGESPDFSDDEKKPEIKKQDKKNTKKISKTEKKPVKNTINNFSAPQKTDENKPEENVIVDLDELLQKKELATEQSADKEEINDALEDFLNDFGFNLEEEAPPENEQDKHINSMFDKYIKNGKISFSKEDIEKINKLLQSEINDDTMDNLSLYAASNPIKTKSVSQKNKLENMVMDFMINQHITFSDADIDALNRLINVEIDKDFVTDLRTNPDRVYQMQQEMEAKQIAHKTHELLTLNVKNALPDLSKELKKRNGKKIEYEGKPEVVYFDKQYDVSKLSVNKELQNITLDFDNPEYKKYRPSDKVEIAATGYEVKTLNIKEELPDLQDALAHPDKYTEKKSEFVPDEESLLNSISNVTFKPFYDGDESLEIYKFDSADDSDLNINTPKEVQSDKNITAEQILEELLNEKENKKTDEKPQELIKLQKREKRTHNKRSDENAEKLLKIIEAQRQERKLKRENAETINHEKAKPTKTTAEKKQIPQKCSVDGKVFSVINTAETSKTTGFYLCKKDNQYFLIGYNEYKKFILKKLKEIKSQRIQVRINKTDKDGNIQYLIRIGTTKFIIDTTPDSMEYVMSL